MVSPKLVVDDLNDAELERVAELLTLKKRLHALKGQREDQEKRHARSVAHLDAELSATQERLDKLSNFVLSLEVVQP